MAKLNIKNEINTPIGRTFQVRELFSHYVGPFIDSVLELRFDDTESFL